MTAVKPITVALLGAAGTSQIILAESLTLALASTSTDTVPVRWQITTDTALQRLLEQAQTSASPPDSAALDIESIEFQHALTQQRRFDHRLLLGLDLAPSTLAGQTQRAGERSRLDRQLRRALTQGDVPFQVIYGEGDERLTQALAAIGALKSPAAPHDIPPAVTSSPRKPWVWACDKCSDPVCEHRLLSDLLLNR